jgi:uncharacterized protein
MEGVSCAISSASPYFFVAYLQRELQKYMANLTLIMMVKAPIMGAVKNRLARKIGHIQALHFYKSASTHVIRLLARDTRWNFILSVTPDIHIRAPFWSLSINRISQGKGNLGQRLNHVLSQNFYGPTIIIGSDIPGITPHHIVHAFKLLQASDAVLGPSPDGGYWLIGTRYPLSRTNIFKEVRWSSTHTFCDTQKVLKGRLALAHTLADVDTEQEWLLWRQSSGAGDGARTRDLRRDRPAL